MTKQAAQRQQDKPEQAAERLGGTEHDVTAGANAGGFENRATDPQEAGKEKSAIDGANSSPQMAARLFESRVQQGGSAH